MGRRGFTLIELSIVLTIIGLMVGGSFKAMQMMNERSRVSAAKEQVLGAKNAVIGFAIEFPSLPSVPVFDQNLSPLQGNQVNQIMYAPANNLLADDVCAFTTTNLSVTVNNVDGSARPPIANVAFVIAHGSANRNLQTALVGNNVIVHAPSEQNIDDNATFVNRLEQYDDIVEWVTLDQLKNEIGCVDKPFRFITDKLPSGKVGVQYPSTSGTAKLEVENNESAATISCSLKSGSPNLNIDFNSFIDSFEGEANASGITIFECNATVDNANANNQKDEIAKKFSITIDPDYSIGATCGSGSDCLSGFCAAGQCTTGNLNAACDGIGIFDSQSRDCKSGICYDADSNGTGVCSGALDNNCIDSTHCLSNYCEDGNCSIITVGSGDINASGLPKNSHCTDDYQCYSGICDQSGNSSNWKCR